MTLPLLMIMVETCGQSAEVQPTRASTANVFDYFKTFSFPFFYAHSLHKYSLQVKKYYGHGHRLVRILLPPPLPLLNASLAAFSVSAPSRQVSVSELLPTAWSGNGQLREPTNQH